jgi:hypothetical protein
MQTVGPNSAHPELQLYKDYYKGFEPAVGLSWSIPYFGKDKTVLRAGYSIGYERSSLRMFNIVVGDQPGLRLDRHIRQLDLLPFRDKDTFLPVLVLPLHRAVRRELRPVECRGAVNRVRSDENGIPAWSGWTKEFIG